jgi:predicted nucleic acid-binding Zn ribbon protein
LDVTNDISAGTEATFGWQSNWGLSGPPLHTFDVGSYFVDQLMPAVTDFMSNGIFSSLCRTRKVGLYPVGTDGRSVGGHSAHAIYSTPPTGGGSSTLLPTEVATACSWQTNQLGKKGKGRIYLPGVPRTVVDDDSSVGAAYSADVVAAGAAFLTAFSLDPVSALDPHLKAVVTGKPYVNYGVIKTVRCGNVFDAQRRRRRQLKETYVESPSGL